MVVCPMPPWVFNKRSTGLEHIWRLLIDVVVEPIAVEQIGVGAPVLAWGLGGVVVGEIAVRDLDGQTFAEVALVFVFEGVAVVLRVTHDKNLASIARCGNVGSRLLRPCQEMEIGTCLDILAASASVARVRGKECIVETTR